MANNKIKSIINISLSSPSITSQLRKRNIKHDQHLINNLQLDADAIIRLNIRGYFSFAYKNKLVSKVKKQINEIYGKE